MGLSRGEALRQPILAPDVESNLIRAWKEREDADALRIMTNSYMRLCYSIASDYTQDEIRMEDLAQEGSQGIRKAIEKYDPTLGTKFSTYSRLWIRNYVAMAASTVLNDITVPARAYLDAKMGRLAAGKNDHAVFAAMPFVMFDEPVGEDGSSYRIDQYARDERTPEAILSEEHDKRYMRELVAHALGDLTEREKNVIIRRKLTEPQETLEEISVDMKVTRERVRQIECAALAKMEAALQRLGIDAASLFRG